MRIFFEETNYGFTQTNGLICDSWIVKFLMKYFPYKWKMIVNNM
jgi:hypothetical protein